MLEGFQSVALVNELPPGKSKVVTVNNREIALFNIEGRYFAIHNRCPHEGGPLCDGAPAQLSDPWQLPQLRSSCPACMSSVLWQSAQTAGAARHALPALWHAEHSVLACAPRNGKSVS